MFQFLRIHTVPPEEEGSTWLQLFFDLVYVAILVELGNRLSHNLSLEGVVTFVILFVPVWWSWLEFVDYGRRYPIDDIGQRILTVLYMAFMLVMAFEIHNLTGTTATAFIVTFGISKFILALMYARVWIYFPTYRHLTRGRAVAFILVGILWIVLAFIKPFNLWLWALVVILGVLMPFFVRLFPSVTDRADLPHPSIKYHFTLHRFGELTIIVLGEFFIKLTISSAGRELTTINYLIGAGLLGISVSLWWLYFDHLEHANLAKAGTRMRVWTIGHFPFMVAITAYGVVGNQIFAARPLAPLDDAQRLLFTTALATALLAFSLIEWASQEKDEPLARSPQPWIRLGAAAALLILGFMGRSLNVGWLVALVVAVLVLQVGLDVIVRLQRPDPEDAHTLLRF
ncbi:MAG: low temperature requirement protein A [Chloroflexota bacterium]|jgi:low temperature requirement protein LtrA